MSRQQRMTEEQRKSFFEMLQNMSNAHVDDDKKYFDEIKEKNTKRRNKIIEISNRFLDYIIELRQRLQ